MWPKRSPAPPCQSSHLDPSASADGGALIRQALMELEMAASSGHMSQSKSRSKPRQLEPKCVRFVAKDTSEH